MEQIINDLPEILRPNIQMNNPNEDILISEGSFTFITESERMDLPGKMVFKWFPSLAVKYYGSIPKDSKGIQFNFLNGDLCVKPEQSVIEFDASLSTLSINEQDSSIDIVCQFTPPIVFGDKDQQVDTVHFELPNLRGIDGDPVKLDNTAYRSRLVFRNEEYEITIDKNIDFARISTQLTNNGGYQLVYAGQLISLKESTFSLAESEIVLEQFSYFLQLVNGSRTSPIFRYGYLDNSLVWRSYSPYEADSYKYVDSWVNQSSYRKLNDLWSSFTEKWNSDKDKECLKTILHWYVEANRNSTKVEGSIVLIQNALELLFHWIVGESEKFVTISDAENISAAAKIGFLLALFDINPDIPKKLSSLKIYEKQFSISNGPELFISMRNSIVHPSEKKRKILNRLDTRGRSQALTLGISYVEIILLKFLDFDGSYRNRAED